MTAGLTDPQARVLGALRDGAALIMHTRRERGAFYTLGGRRLSVTLLKDLELLRYVSRSSGAGRTAVAYELIPGGSAALAQWESGNPASRG